MEYVNDATLSLGKGLKKSFRSYGKEAKGIVQSLTDLIDPEDLLKSIHKVAHPEEHQKNTIIVHTPIDWSKYPPSAFRRYSHDFPSTKYEDDDDENEEEEYN